MQLSRITIKRNMKWHLPVSVATLAMGIYLTLVYMIPSFVPEYHHLVTTGRLYLIIPYAIFIMIGAPLYTLWVYTKMENDEEFCEQYFE